MLMEVQARPEVHHMEASQVKVHHGVLLVH